MKIMEKMDMNMNKDKSPFNNCSNYIFLPENTHKDMTEDECLIELFMEDEKNIKAKARE